MEIFQISLFFNDTATTEIYTLSLHDALPICALPSPFGRGRGWDDDVFSCSHDSADGANALRRCVNISKAKSYLQSPPIHNEHQMIASSQVNELQTPIFSPRGKLCMIDGYEHHHERFSHSEHVAGREECKNGSCSNILFRFPPTSTSIGGGRIRSL